MSKPNPVIVTNADIDAALRELREEAHGHEPWAPAVHARALSIATVRATRELDAGLDMSDPRISQECTEDHHHWDKD